MNATGLHLAQHMGKHYRQAFFGGNWSDNCYQQHIDGLDYRLATEAQPGANSIAAIVYHVHFFINGVLSVLEGRELVTGDDKSWQTPSFTSQAEWDSFVARVLAEAEQLAQALEALPEGGIWAHFYDPKYSSIFTNGLGILEHSYYHLGQIALLRKQTT